MKDNALRSFAGHPLKFRGELLGVLAMFGRRPLSEEEFERLAVFANEAAIAIKNAQLFTEVEQLKNRLQAENLYLQEEIKHQHNFEEIIGESPASKPFYDTSNRWRPRIRWSSSMGTPGRARSWSRGQSTI